MPDLFSLVGQLLAGWIIADLIGGFVHWYEDRVAWPATPILEKHIWGPNRLHHDEPMLFTMSGFWWRNSTTLIAGAILGTVWWMLWGPSWAWLGAIAGGSIQNEIHLYAHKPRTGFLKVLQQVGIIQSVAGHARHHRPPSNSNYCVLTDWCNPILEHFRIWTRLERLLRLPSQSS